MHDRQASLAFARETIGLLKEKLHIGCCEEAFELYHEEEYGETIFTLPVYDVEFSLRNGFWLVESSFHYCQLVMHKGDYFKLRCMPFDIARALGQQEAWYAKETFTWNGVGLCELPESTFEGWLESATKRYGAAIPEFDQASILACDKMADYDYAPIYHDSFEACKIHFDALQLQLTGYKLLGLYRIGDAFLRCEKDDRLFLINEHTLSLLFEELVDDVLCSLNGREFIVVKDGLSAVFDGSGNQLTAYVTGEFEWKWASPDLLNLRYHDRIIFNDEANIRLLV